MSVGVNVGGVGANAVTDIRVRNAGGLKQVTQGLIRISKKSIVTFYQLFKVTLSKAAAIGRGNSSVAVTVYSEPVTATVQGGVGDLTYAWTRTAPDAHAWTIDAADQATTTFSTLAAQGESWNATFICTVTDQAGQVLASAAVAVNCANIYYGGGYLGGGGGGPVGGGEWP